MEKLFLATRNQGKVKEIRHILSGIPYEILSMDNFPDIPEIEETGDTFQENALIKAREVFSHTGLLTLADDSGLEVDALGMRPGVFSARYAGEPTNYAENNKKLLSELKNITDEKRGARFRCVVALVTDGEEHIFEGTCEGTIIHELRGTNGFGYDPLFQPDGYDRTFAELPAEVKNTISHRGKALQKVYQYLKD